MQVYKTFLKIALRYIPSTIWMLFMFIGVSFAVAKAYSSDAPASYTTKKVKIAVVDEDSSALSEKLYDYLSSTHKLVDIGDESTWADEMFAHTVEYILVIEKGFEEQAQNGKYDCCLTSCYAPDSNSAYIVQSQVNSYMQNIKSYMAGGYTLSESADKALETVSMAVDVEFAAENKEASPKPIAYFFAILPYMMLMMVINALGPTLLAWNKSEIKARTAISGVSLASKNISIIGAMITFSAFIMLLYMGSAAIVYKADFFTERTIYYALNSFIYLIVCVATALLVAQLAHKLSALSIFSNVYGLASSFFCGVFVSRELLPDKLNVFAHCLPPYWYINVSDELAYYSGNLSQNAWISMGVQLLFAAALFAVTLTISKLRSQKEL